MEVIVNTIVVFSLFTSLTWFCWVLVDTLIELYQLHYPSKPKIRYKVGDIDGDCIVYLVDITGVPYWRILETEIPKEEPEEKIRIPMTKFEDIPFGVVEKIPDKLKISVEEFEIRREIGSGIQIEDNRHKQKYNYVWYLADNEPEILKTEEYVWKNGECWPKEAWDAKQKKDEYDTVKRNWEIEQKKSQYSYTQGGIIRKIPDPRMKIPATPEDFEKIEILKLCPSLFHYEKVMTHYGYGPGNEFSYEKLSRIRYELETQNRIRSRNRELASYNK